MSSPEKKVWKGSHGLITTNYDNDQGSYSSRKLLPDRLATPFWPLFEAKKAKSSKHLRSRYLRSTVTSRDLASASITNLKIHSDLQQGLCLPPKVQLVAGVHRNPLISNHFAGMYIILILKKNQVLFSRFFFVFKILHQLCNFTKFLLQNTQ